MIDIDASFIAIFIIVWIMVFVLSRLFFNPLRKIMEEREAKVKGRQEAFQESTEIYEKTVCEIEERLKSGRILSEQTKDNLKHEALKKRERMLEEISTEYRSQVEKAQEKLEKQTTSLRRELGAEAKLLAERIEQKLLE
jgi:F-type H+-transporting ATPase subunit b